MEPNNRKENELFSTRKEKKSQEIAVVGAGICGRLVALRLALSGHHVTVFEKNKLSDRLNCSSVAAGMLAPFAEAVYGDVEIVGLGLESLELWKNIGQDFFQDSSEIYQQRFGLDSQKISIREEAHHRISFHGSLVVAHEQNIDELFEYQRRLKQKIPNAPMNFMNHGDISKIEPDIAQKFFQGIFFPTEAHLDTWSIMDHLAEDLLTAEVVIRQETEVHRIEPYEVHFQDHERFVKTQQFDIIFDTRGMGAKKDLPNLRGVRGETLVLTIPQDQNRITLSRPIRILHPRHPIYLVPRTHDTFILGASMVESDSEAPITVHTALELLTALYHAHDSFKFANVTKSMCSVRPAFPNHRPHITCEPGLIRINGLFRHGFLLAPIVAKTAVDMFHGENLSVIQKVLSEKQL